MAEMVDAPFNNRSADLRYGELSNFSRFESGFPHKAKPEAVRRRIIEQYYGNY